MCQYRAPLTNLLYLGHSVINYFFFSNVFKLICLLIGLQTPTKNKEDGLRRKTWKKKLPSENKNFQIW